MFIFFCSVAVKTSNKEKELKNISKTFDNLLKTYDKKLRPDAGGKKSRDYLPGGVHNNWR